MKSSSKFDADWRKKAVNGDQGAIQQFVQAALEPLFQFCFYRVGRNRHLCEEVVQETIVRAISDLTKYQPARSKNSVFPWLYGLARNEIRRALAREPNTMSLESLWANLDRDLREILARIDSEPLNSDVLKREETVEIVNATMSQIPQHYREALEAKYLSRKTVRDIASEQSASIKSIESLLSRARQAFRETFLALIRNLNSEAAPSPIK